MSRKRSGSLEELDENLSPEDGHNPRRFHDRRNWGQTTTKAGRKAQQLCEQVGDALRTILDGLADEVLQNLTVLMVEPAPNTGRLQVTVADSTPADATDLQPAATILQALSKAAGLIRSEVAARIHRRYAPELTFAVL